ncbi:MAG: radical SAM protein [Deltaproteobacteria bacterium]
MRFAHEFKHGRSRNRLPHHKEGSPDFIDELPVLVLSPHNRCNCRCLMCDIWKIRGTREITPLELEPHLESLRRLKVKWVVFSGGEPLLHSNLASLCKPIRAEGIRVTILTAGTILGGFATLVAENADDLIVSLDGPEQVHNEIRGIPRAYARLTEGIAAVRRIEPAMSIAGRCTVQKTNHRHLRATVNAARQAGLNSISFLPADVTSQAFNRPQSWPEERQDGIALDDAEIEVLADEIESLIREYCEDIRSEFVVEDAAKLRRIVLHFRARLGQVAPVAPRCNAPWVSAVVEADGSVRPCFFHPTVGNLNDRPLHDIFNGSAALAFRRALDIPTDPVCRKCVCSLFIPRAPAR